MTDFSKLKITLPNVDIGNINIERLLDIDVHNLEETMRHQATLYCTFGLLARDAEKQYSQLKFKLDEIESRIRIETVDLKGKVVQADINAACNTDAQYIAITNQLAVIKHAASVAATIEESFSQRFGMVQQIAKRRSTELAQLQ